MQGVTRGYFKNIKQRCSFFRGDSLSSSHFFTHSLTHSLSHSVRFFQFYPSNHYKALLCHLSHITATSHPHVSQISALSHSYICRNSQQYLSHISSTFKPNSAKSQPHLSHISTTSQPYVSRILATFNSYFRHISAMF